jgi:hypothetical protein
MATQLVGAVRAVAGRTRPTKSVLSIVCGRKFPSFFPVGLPYFGIARGIPRYIRVPDVFLPADTCCRQSHKGALGGQLGRGSCVEDRNTATRMQWIELYHVVRKGEGKVR